jgi:hypothetical protein
MIHQGIGRGKISKGMYDFKEAMLPGGVNGTRGLITCNAGALKSHNLQNGLTGH